jgi:lauroyl/myristoyl acyltransferase
VKSTVARWINQSRAFLPAATVPWIVAARTRIARRRPQVWADAQRQMRFVMGDDASDELINRLAAAYIRRSIWRGESRWHPHLVTEQRIIGVERLRALRETGTGFIVNFVHLGDYEGISPSLARAGIPNTNLATSDIFQPGGPVWQQQQARVVDSHEDVSLMDVALGSAGVKKALAQGAVVAIATDQPGHTPVRFLGREMSLSSGAARIAKEMSIPVAVVTTHPDPANPDGCGMFKVAEVLDPREFESVEALLEVMISRHEEAFRAWPEAAEHPLRMIDRELVKPPSRHAPSQSDAEQEPGAQSG